MRLNATSQNTPVGEGRKRIGRVARGLRPGGLDGKRGFTLQETVMSMALTALIVAGAARAHVAAASRAEWSSCSFAAQNAAAQRAEQVRAARWDNLANPPVDQVVATNYLPQVTVLEVPSIGTNVVYATNFTTIGVISLDPPMRVIRTDCVWRFTERGLFTNSTVVYRGPDQ